MKRLEHLIAEIKKQLFPYSHAADVERSCERWSVSESDCLTSWTAEQLKNCRKKNKCDSRGLCVYYSHSDLASRNYAICREMILLFESGYIRCEKADIKDT